MSTEQHIAEEHQDTIYIDSDESLTKKELQKLLKGKHGNTKIFFQTKPVKWASYKGNKIILGYGE